MNLQLPHDNEAERTILGSCLLYPERYPVAAGIIRAEMFWDERHQVIWEAVAHCASKGNVDVLVVTDYLRRKTMLTKAGGSTYLTALTSIHTIQSGVESTSLIIRDKHNKRQAIGFAERLTELGFGGDDTGDVIQEVEKWLVSLQSDSKSDKVQSANNFIDSAIAAVEKAKETGTYGIPTGLADLDRLIGGWSETDLVIVGARPGVGKTALGVQTAAHAASLGIPVGIISLEMSADQIGIRLLSAACKIDSKELKRGKVHDDDWKKVYAGAARLSKLPVYCYDTPAQTFVQIRAKALSMARTHGIQMLVVDYLQLIRGYDKRSQATQRWEEVGKISAGLKGLAKELRIPVIALAQLNRGIEQRKNETPNLSDLRESGSIEQDADICIFLHKTELDDKTERHVIKVAKNRHGECGTFPIHWHGPTTTFRSVAYGAE